MTSLRAAGKLVIATHNDGKLIEFRDLLALPGITCVSAGALGFPEPEETGVSYAENARLKARAAASASGLPALADDSGLSVAALGGAPGIYSARWAVTASGARDFTLAMKMLEEKLRAAHIEPTGAPAAFICALALVMPGGGLLEAQGRIDGTLLFPPRGSNGFGYDPVFVPAGEVRTFGEMGREEKARHSHRAAAVAALRQKL